MNLFSARRTPRVRHVLVGSIVLAVLVGSWGSGAAFADTHENGGARRNDGDNTAFVRSAIKDGPAKNVILLIGDGMGDSEITIARNYAYGAAGKLPGIDALPLTGQYTTYSLHKDGPLRGKPDYVPDSAATGSAWATGTKTYDGAISVDINGVPQQTLIELARANGLRTGNVTTAEVQDATPAVQVAHVGSRKCFGPDSRSCGSDALEQGGLGSISEQTLDTRPDLTLGGGAASFAQRAKAGPWKDQTLFEQAEDRGYQVARDASGLSQITEANQEKPLLGIFTDGNFPTRFAPTTATVGGADHSVSCEPNRERLSPDLSLASLTNKALSLLDVQDGSGKGFFLQVEGASIDKRDHQADACGQIGETIDLDEAVRAALDFAEKDGNTMVIVTADHAHTSQIVDSTPPKSLSTAVTTLEGSVMKISYGTAGSGESQQHTGTQLRVAGYGPGAANVVGLIDQTDNFFTISSALQLSRNTADLSADGEAELTKETFAPGEKIDLTFRGLRGDRQITGVIASNSEVPIPKTDVLRGAATLSLEAPEDLGEHTITVTGSQSGKAITARFVVTADGASSPGVAASPSSPSNSTGVGDFVWKFGVSLATTGSAALPLVLALTLAILALGGGVILRARWRS
ncbi:alkaline phosphatase [Lysinibacter sp. HNR]|uniref:alkaline phosphatase n=1 Tax=Lysinibacter sp. HNR TaxID=3031408 RepID=UPI002435BED7|nr:alkaline phosphatase [Lysinibacter sp. HNR]WGD38263.1 alkaline phosphatase [Lysinibacter sp. HNR]